MSRTFFSLHRSADRVRDDPAPTPTKRQFESSVSAGRSVPPANGFISWQRLRRAIRRLTSGTVVRWQPWFYLRLALSARGLLLFRVIRGGIELSQRLGARGTMAYRAYRYSPSTPSVARTDSSIARSTPPLDGKGLSTEDAQATRDFSFAASKLSPFFQMVSTTAAILRASVNRAIAGSMPLASKPS